MFSQYAESRDKKNQYQNMLLRPVCCISMYASSDLKARPKHKAFNRYRVLCMPQQKWKPQRDYTNGARMPSSVENIVILAGQWKHHKNTGIHHVWVLTKSTDSILQLSTIVPFMP